MTQSDHSGRRSGPHGPKRRDDSTHPASTRRGAERRPYPTASTTTRVSPANPGSASARSRSRGSTLTPTPATVWTAGPDPIELDEAWPTPIVEKIVGAFSEPGGQVALLPRPTARPISGDRPPLTPVFSDVVLHHAPEAGQADEVVDARAAVEGLRRTVRVVRVPVAPTCPGPGSRPFWADLVERFDSPPVTASSPSRSDLRGRVLEGAETAPADTDLIITSVRPEDGGDRASDVVALVAARLLRVGGILAVITHCDWLAGELIDPTGAVVASAQNADLLYLQHIIALHTPVRDGRFAVESVIELDAAAAEAQARAAHRTAVRGLPVPHRRIHSDVLVFAQPHQYEPLSGASAEQAFDTGVIR